MNFFFFFYHVGSNTHCVIMQHKSTPVFRWESQQVFSWSACVVKLLGSFCQVFTVWHNRANAENIKGLKLKYVHLYKQINLLVKLLGLRVDLWFDK